MIKKIAITGPESTGKTSLAKDLAKHYKAIWVPEFARTYLQNITLPYTAIDLDNIAQGQIDAIKKALAVSEKYLFADTELIVMKIWYENAFKKCPKWLSEALEAQEFDLYLLCAIDLPWTYDPQREHPHMREHFFNLYIKELESRNLPYSIISGNKSKRTANAVKAVSRL